MAWQVEIRHEGLGKYRVVKGVDRNEVEQRARAQMLAWESQHLRRMDLEIQRKSRELVRLTKENGKIEADRITSEARKNLEDAKSILRHTLKIDDRIVWEDLKTRPPFTRPKPLPVPAPSLPPEPTFCEPPLSFLDWLIPGYRRKAVARTREAFNARRKAWLEETDRIEAAHSVHQKSHQVALKDWQIEKEAHDQKKIADAAAVETLKQNYLRGNTEAIVEYCEIVLSRSSYPAFCEREFQFDYSIDQKVGVVDLLLPNPDSIPKIKSAKYVASSNTIEYASLKEKEVTQLYDEIIYQIALRTVHELFEADVAGAIEALVFNGFVNYIDRSNGHEVKACILTLHVNKDAFVKINLGSVVPSQCFRGLRGVAAPQLATLTPVAPFLQLKREDPRFVSKEDISALLNDGINIAAIGWEEFEHLIREIFEKEFSGPGSEVKVTRASRDAGVDAIIFDPDPVRGGKIVVQAKRYTNVVDVSSVRDLYGTVMNEGANKGILVTTSHFGNDAYSFAINKPIALIDGQNLLFLLEKHGKKVRLDLKEAKDLGVGLQRRSL